MNSDPHGQSVSAVVPAYNAARTLPATLASIESQTVNVLEILVVDDGSRDATAEVARDRAAHLISASSPRRTQGTLRLATRASRQHAGAMSHFWMPTTCGFQTSWRGNSRRYAGTPGYERSRPVPPVSTTSSAPVVGALPALSEPALGHALLPEHARADVDAAR